VPKGRLENMRPKKNLKKAKQIPFIQFCNSLKKKNLGFGSGSVDKGIELGYVKNRASLKEECQKGYFYEKRGFQRKRKAFP